MISTILSDFSNVILYAKDKNCHGTLNGLYKSLVEKYQRFNFYDYFIFNEKLLNYFQKLKDNYSINILTSGTIQNNSPEIKEKIKGIFDKVLTTADYGTSKNDSQIYYIIAKELNKKPEEMILIDDQIENINAAKEAGLTTSLFNTNGKLFNQLDKLLKR